MKKYILTILSLLFIIPTFAYEDCIVTTNGKLTEIKIQNNSVIDVFPLITILNDKNTLIVHPLKTGKTKFSVVKNKKDKYTFNVEVSSESTSISNVEGFDILTIDCPYSKKPETVEIEIDEPPVFESFDNELDDLLRFLDAPPEYRGDN